MRALRAQLRRSPAVASNLVRQGHRAPALRRATDVLLHILRDAGFDGRRAASAAREITWSTLGFVSVECRAATSSRAARSTALDNAFSAVVSHLLAGLASELAPARPASPAPRLAFVHVDDVPWTEVIAQLHGERRVSVHEKFLEWNAARMVVLGRYDPRVVIERHGHASDHLVYVLEGELRVGERRCAPGTLVVLELGASFGPLVAGEQGALLLEVWMGDPRPVPGNKEEYHALLRAKGIVRLPNPPIVKPETAPRHADDGKDLYS
jgi:hypothetical protein